MSLELSTYPERGQTPSDRPLAQVFHRGRRGLTPFPDIPFPDRLLEPSFEHELPVWELRVGAFRVFYDVQEDERQVHVRAVTTQRTPAYNGGYLVKTIQSEELQANLNEVLNSARNERIVIYR
jgi:hypothetical protein